MTGPFPPYLSTLQAKRHSGVQVGGTEVQWTVHQKKHGGIGCSTDPRDSNCKSVDGDGPHLEPRLLLWALGGVARFCFVLCGILLRLFPLCGGWLVVGPQLECSFALLAILWPTAPHGFSMQDTTVCKCGGGLAQWNILLGKVTCIHQGCSGS